MKMKMLAILIVGANLISQDGFAQTSPLIEMSQDARIVAEILLNKQLKYCVTKIQSSPYELKLNKITYQAMTEDQFNYQLAFRAIVGGNSVGYALLKVNEQIVPSALDNTHLFSCVVTMSENK